MTDFRFSGGRKTNGPLIHALQSTPTFMTARQLSALNSYSLIEQVVAVFA